MGFEQELLNVGRDIFGNGKDCAPKDLTFILKILGDSQRVPILFQEVGKKELTLGYTSPKDSESKLTLENFRQGVITLRKDFSKTPLIYSAFFEEPSNVVNCGKYSRETFFWASIGGETSTTLYLSTKFIRGGGEICGKYFATASLELPPYIEEMQRFLGPNRA